MSSSGGASSPTTPEAPGSSLSNATNSASTTTHAGATSNAQARPPSAPGGGSPPSSPEGKKSPFGRRTRRRRTSPPIKKRLEARKEQKGYRNAEEGKQHIDKKLQAASENRASMRRNIVSVWLLAGLGLSSLRVLSHGCTFIHSVIHLLVLPSAKRPDKPMNH
eukprot:gb/GECG01002912.1/.p1 GENE.gb/GECG01002912.1/~~gb/GECG01002912.1/.p1  ORF type:complete len:163 (+),score=20.63 gb/GECG01002912.1/:1-489(+)